MTKRIIGLTVILLTVIFSVPNVWAANVSGTISTDTTWTLADSPYNVTGNITVSAGATLTIEPGVVVKFNQYKGIYIDGTLQAVGTIDAPITFTGTSETNGHWGALYIRGTGSATLEYCDIAYGGDNYYSNWGGYNCLLKTGSGSLTLKNSTIRNSGTDGLGLQPGSSLVVMENNTFKDNNRYGVKLGINASFDDNTSDFFGNAVADLYVDGGEITGPVTWNLKSDYSLYVSSNITIAKDTGKNGVLTIKPGVVVKFAQYSGIYIDGQMMAKGTAASPIYFTDWHDDTIGGDANKDGNNSVPAPYWWGSIYLRNSGTATLEHCLLSYGGNNYYSNWSSNNGIYKTGSGDLTLTDCTVSNVYGNGISVTASTGNVTLSQSIFTNNTASGLVMNSGPATATNCTFSNNGDYGILQEINDVLISTNNTFTGNTLGSTGINGGTINGNITWRQGAGSPFRVTGSITVPAGATLTIEPGVVVQFNRYKGIWVDGTLQAVGNSAAPIKFTGVSETNGHWGALYIRGTGSATLEYCDIAYGGDNYYSNWGGYNCLLKTGSGSLTLKNSTIRNSGTDGLGLQPGSSLVVMENNTFKDNNRYGVKLGINASFDDNTSDFFGNAVADLYVDGGEITGPVTWNLKSDYSLYVSSNITIARDTDAGKDGVLTIKPGAVVKFAQYSGIYIDGEMMAKGTVGSPIYFTDWRDDTIGGDANKNSGADVPAPGWWGSIYLRNSGTATLEHCLLSYGGNNYYSNWSGNNGIYKTGGSDLDMTSCTVSNVYGNGISVTASTGNVTLSQSIFTNNTASGLVMNSGPATATNCTFSNNGNYGILQEINDVLISTNNIFTGNTLGSAGINGGTINGNITWRQGAGSPFRVTGSITVPAGATLTIEPGVVVQFNRYKGIWIDGTLQAKGTSDAPIKFTGATETNGYWGALYIRGVGSADLEYCDIAYGGDNYYSDWGGYNCLLKTGSGSLTLKNSIIRNSGADGLGLQQGSSSVVMENNTFKDNNRYGVKLSINASFDDNTTDFSGNASADLFVDGGEITGPVIWNLKSDYSLYVSSNITIVRDTDAGKDGVLTIKPGTVVKFAHYSGIYIDGEMLAQGTVGSPIYFTDWRDDSVGGNANKNSDADGPSPGWWGSIYLQNSGSATLEHCLLSYGGDNYYSNWSGNNGIYKTGTGDLSMTSCNLSNTSGNGLTIANSTGNHLISRNTFTLNTTGVYILNQTDPITINGNAIEANTTWGMLSQNSATVNAGGNWWGDATGPHHDTLNPDGQGDNVSDGVLFDPWRTTAGQGEIVAPIRSGTLVQGDSLRFMGSNFDDPTAGYLWTFGDNRTAAVQNPGMVNFPTAGALEVQYHAVINGTPDPYPDTRAFTVVADTGSYPDLQVIGMTIPDSLAVGQPATITYNVRNTGNSEITGVSWEDTIYFSDDPYLDIKDIPLGSVTVSSSVAPGASYQDAININLPTVEEGTRYLIVSVNDNWQMTEQHRLNNEKASSVNVLIPALASDTSHTGDYAQGKVEHYYKITASNGHNLLLNFTPDKPGLEAYVRFGALPTRGVYDYRLTGAPLSIPAATAGQWYVLIYGNMPEAGQYEIKYVMTDLALSGISPNRQSTLENLELSLVGVGFIAPLDVELVDNGGTAHTADSVAIDSYTRTVATFTAGSVPAGTYTVRVSHGDNSDELASALEIIQGGTPKLETRLILPDKFGYHQLATVYVEYSNTGNAPMPAPLLLVTASQNNGSGSVKNGAFMTLSSTKLSTGFWTSAIPEGFSHSVQFLASGEKPGVLQPGESRRVPVYYAGWQRPWDFSYPPFEWNVGVLDANNDTPIDWARIKDGMRPTYVSDDAWEVVWNNFTGLAGNTWGDYVAMLSRNAVYLDRIGERINDIGPMLSLAFREADGLNPLSLLAAGSDAAIKAPGLSIVFKRSYAQPISRRFELGPLGYGWTHNWQYRLTKDADDGTVEITNMSGTPRIFQPDSRYPNRYLGQPGDHGALRDSGTGGFLLTESNGIIRAFTADGRLDYIKDTNNNRITCTYTGDNLTGLTHSSDPSLTLAITYNGDGLISTVTDNLGRQTIYTYNGEYLASVTTYDGRTTTYNYDTSPDSASLHALIKVGLPDDTHRFFTYDDHGRLTTAYRDANTEKTTFSYIDGRVDATDALKDTNRFFFDYGGRMVKGENALGEAVQLAFDDLGNLTAVTDPDGISTTFAYDSKGNLTEISDAMRQKTRFTYARTYNRLASVIDVMGNRTIYDYDNKGNPLSIAYPDGSSESWDWDAQGNPTAWTNRRGNPVNYTYDAQGRLTGKTYADTTSVTYTYDNRGNLQTAVDSTGTTTFAYDENDRLTRIDYPGGRYLIFTYDDAGRRTSSKDQLGYIVNYQYDTAGRLSRLSDGNDLDIVLYNYDALGRVSKKTMGNKVYSVYAYDAAGRLLSLTNHKPDGTELSRFEYAYDRRGRRISMTTHYGAWTYSYDDLGQLTRAKLTSTDPDITDQDLVYEYDALGNRIKTVVNGAAEDYSANELNQYVSVGNRTYTYDADGNLIKETGPDGITTYSYDDENRLVGVAKGGDTWQYTYDALGNRAAVDENGITTHYMVDPVGFGNTIGEYKANGDLIARYTHGFGLLSKMLPSGTSDYYTFDSMGNTSEITDPDGVIQNAYAYQPFGTTIAATQTDSNPFQFMGEFGSIKDSSGLTYARARYYSETMGRFVQADPIGIGGGSTNFYRYADNYPVGMFDPLGMKGRLCGIVQGSLKTVGGFGKMGLGVTLIVETGGIGGWAGLGLFVSGIYDTGVGVMQTTYHGAMSIYEHIHKMSRKEQMADDAVSNAFQKGLPGAVLEMSGSGSTASDIADKATDIVSITSPSDIAMTGISWVAPNFCGWSKKPPSQPNVPTSAGAHGNSGTVGSHDPNQKQTIAGFGSPNYVAGNTDISYRIDFENMKSATAPAQIVTVSDQLSGYLDWSSFELLEVGFGNIIIPIPSGQQYFEKDVDYIYNDDDYDFNVKVHVEIGIENGRIYASFSTIDPDTGLPPDVSKGFLMPENDTGRGKAYISYTVRPKSGVASGTAVRNIATIQFDYSTKIDTNQKDPDDPSQGTDPAKEALITFDSGAPLSTVEALPAQTHSGFTVSWSGTDDVNGAGIAGYDIYARENSDSWSLWKSNTADTSAVYDGIPGKTYGFYSIAIDNAGNMESAPARADAETLVIPYKKGDVNGDDIVDLADAILAAKITAGVDTGDANIIVDAAMNGNEKIGITEMIYILGHVTGLRGQ